VGARRCLRLLGGARDWTAVLVTADPAVPAHAGPAALTTGGPSGLLYSPEI